jgi:hypothetical protein
MTLNRLHLAATDDRLTPVDLIDVVLIDAADLRLAGNVDLAARSGNRELALAKELLQVALEVDGGFLQHFELDGRGIRGKVAEVRREYKHPRTKLDIRLRLHRLSPGLRVIEAQKKSRPGRGRHGVARG